MLLNKNNFPNCIKQESKIVEFDGFEVKIIKLGLKDYLSIAQQSDNGELIKNLLLLCCVDENNEKLFTDDEINQLPPEIALKLFNECDELNKLRTIDLEDRAKNS